MTKEQLNKLSTELYNLSIDAKNNGEVPLAAALLLPTGEVFYAANEVERTGNPLKHAEINVINRALEVKRTRYLNGATLLVTLEPCLFCLGAILKTNISSLYYFAEDEKEGSLSYYHVFTGTKLQVNSIEDARFERLLKDFFSTLREK